MTPTHSDECVWAASRWRFLLFEKPPTESFFWRTQPFHWNCETFAFLPEAIVIKYNATGQWKRSFHIQLHIANGRFHRSSCRFDRALCLDQEETVDAVLHIRYKVNWNILTVLQTLTMSSDQLVLSGKRWTKASLIAIHILSFRLHHAECTFNFWGSFESEWFRLLFPQCYRFHSSFESVVRLTFNSNCNNGDFTMSAKPPSPLTWSCPSVTSWQPQSASDHQASSRQLSST